MASFSLGGTDPPELNNPATDSINRENLAELEGKPFGMHDSIGSVLRRARKPFVRKCSEFSAGHKSAIRYKTPRVPGTGSHWVVADT